ncbi:glycosyltransferase [Geobacter argillaceus]|uniref:Glycosyltransferase involved in cell wall biosynthesis n=1 Tax=Geobacter argillaceus TaxID=345631 RepID=A0A562VHJ0_9BACT|nr:glycosyltransferase [Geobacter argillaceus]TWJ17318.1 glycosyltransferase involved in cell wall biosynthesis [Geobacter argillaceus]
MTTINRQSPEPTGTKHKIAFILSRFPSYDETFILRELHALADKLDFVIFSLRYAVTGQIVHAQAKDLLGNTLYLPYLFSLQIFIANLVMLLTRPLRYVAALVKIIARDLPCPEFLVKALVFFPKSVAFARWAEKNQITYLHALWATYPASVAQVVKDLTGIPFSFMGHAHDIYQDTTGLAEKIMAAEFVSTCTRQNKDHLLAIAPKAPPEKIEIIHHGLDLALFQSPPGKGNAVYQILSVGTLQDYKGVNYLVDALALLKTRGITFHGTIIGDGPMEQAIKAQIARLGLTDCITMTGPLTQAEVVPYYRKSDVSVLMAQAEKHWGIPNVLIESLAARTAVITTRFGSVEELIRDGETGIIVEGGNAAALADALACYYNDPSLRQAHAETGCQLVMEEFDLSRNIEAYRKRFCT